VGSSSVSRQIHSGSFDLFAYANRRINSLTVQGQIGQPLLREKEGDRAMSAEIDVVRVQVLPGGRMNRANAAKYLGRWPPTLASWAMQPKGLQPHNVGGRAYYYLQELDSFIANSADVDPAEAAEDLPEYAPKLLRRLSPPAGGCSQECSRQRMTCSAVMSEQDPRRNHPLRVRAGAQAKAREAQRHAAAKATA
jgi:hypothetical protein